MELIEFFASLVTLGIFLNLPARGVYRMLVPQPPTALGSIAPPRDARPEDYILTELYR